MVAHHIVSTHTVGLVQRLIRVGHTVVGVGAVALDKSACIVASASIYLVNDSCVRDFGVIIMGERQRKLEYA